MKEIFNEKIVRGKFIGLEDKVDIVNGKRCIPINFDNAATTPVLKSVLDKIIECSKMYGSIGRGLGQKSEYSTRIYNECREYVLEYFNVPKEEYTAIFIANATDGLNKLSRILIKNEKSVVITTRMEHHSNDLPWRGKCKVDYIEVDELGRLKLEELEEKLMKYSNQEVIVTLTAASNVTGYINDIKYISSLVHKYNGKLVVDGAQIVAHKKVSFIYESELEYVDFFVFSAHKIYAPFGSGAIIGRKDVLNQSIQSDRGGGTVEAVLDYSDIIYNTPERNEAGSPNLFGAVALVQAIKEIVAITCCKLEEKEKILLNATISGLNSIPKVIMYGDTINITDRLGIVVFNVEGIYNEEVAKSLARHRGIAVRQGAFCAHPYVKRLLKLSEEEATKYVYDKNYKMPGMVRASFGMYNTLEEVNIFLETVEDIAKGKL